MARSGLPRWFWPLLAALCALLLLLQVLLQHSSDGDAATGEGVAGAGARSRAPFPKGGELSGVRRKPEVEPREKSVADPWQEGRKQK
jgi:hypothetical protein